VKSYSAEYDYEITTPSGRVVRPPAGACWRVSKVRFDELVADGRISFGKDGNNVPAIKRFLKEVKQGITPLTIWTYDEVGHNQEATQEVRALGIIGFDSPKPVRLLIRALQVCTAQDDIVVDFFAGSGTTAHAVMAHNTADGGKRRYILVQLPEPLDSGNKDQKMAADFCDQLGKPRNIAELTKERLRRAGKKIKEENPLFKGDLGFRVFKLDSSNIRAWEPDRANLAATLEQHAEHLKTDRTEDDILFELLLKLGLDLTVPIEHKTIAGKAVHSIGAGTLLVCLATQITAAEVESLALGIVDWHKKLAPAGETQLVFRDSAFADDVAKTNLTAILQQYGIENVRSL
jgi:adenine-specific DNA-methyltransferase